MRNVTAVFLLVLVVLGGSHEVATAFVPTGSTVVVVEPYYKYDAVRRLRHVSTTTTTVTTVTTTTRLYNGFKPLNRQQAKVEIDPLTGLYRPIRKTNEPSNNNNNNKKKLKQLSDQWDGFKEIVYDGVNVVQSVNEKVQQSAATTTPLSLFFAQSSPPPPTSSKTAAAAAKTTKNSNDYNVMEGYAKIEKEFRGDQEKKKKKRNTAATAATTGSDDNGIGSSDDSSSSSSSSTLFDTIKERLYESVDAATNLVMSNQGDSSSSKMAKSPFAALEESTSTTTLGSFKPSVRARLAAPDEVFKALENANNNNSNNNPIQKLATGIQVRQVAWKEEARQAALERQAALDNFKERLYQASDTIQETQRQIVQLPKVVATTAQKVVATTRQTMDTVQAAPSKIQQQADHVKQSIQESIQTTKNVIETVQAIPGRVQTTVTDMKKTVQTTAQATQETVQLVQDAAKEVSTTTKVLMGLEKPVPKPPKSSPPPPGTERSLPKALLQGTGKVVWFLGKEGVSLLGKVGQLVVELGSEALQQQQQQQPAVTTTTTTSKATMVTTTDKKPSPPPPRPKTTPSNVKIGTRNSASSSSDAAAELEAAAASSQQQPPTFKMPSDEEIRQKDEDMKRLELEIEEALRLADDAIQQSSSSVVQEEEGAGMDDSTKSSSSSSSSSIADGDDEKNREWNI